MLAYDCNSQKSLTRWDYVPVILAKSSRRKSRYRTGSLTRCEIVRKRCLLVWICKSQLLQMHFKCAACQLLHLKQSRFGILKAQLYEADASVKQNTRNTIKQLISFKLAMKMQGERWSTKRLKLLEKLLYSVSFCVSLGGAESSGH